MKSRPSTDSFKHRDCLIINFPPFPAECGPFITMGDPNSKDISKNLKSTTVNINYLKKMFSKYKRKAERAASAVMDLNSQIYLQYLNNESAFLRAKLMYLVAKHKMLTRDISAEISTKISLMICCFDKFLDSGIPVQLDSLGFDSLIKQKFKSNRKFQRIYFKIQSIQARLKKPEVNHESRKSQLMADLKSSEMFDSEFETSLGQSDILQKIDPVAKNLSAFPSLLNDLARELDADRDSLPTLRRCLARIVFDRAFLFNKVAFSPSSEFLKNCRIIQFKSFDDISIPRGFASDESREMPMIEVFHHEPALWQISLSLDALLFLSSPIDIAEVILSISKSIEVFFRGDKYKGKARISLDFDQYFSMFIAVLASNPPANAEEVCSILESGEFLEMGPKLKHAATTFIGAVKYIKGYTKGDKSPKKS